MKNKLFIKHKINSKLTNIGFMKTNVVAAAGFAENHQFEITPAVKEDTQTVIKERQEIIRREASREQKTKLLFNKKDQKSMTFFDSWRYSGKEVLCSKKCTDLNKRREPVAPS